MDKIDLNGNSPLYYAISKGYIDIANLLYFKGGSVHAPTEELSKTLCK